jgi:hypothetical protein
MQFAAGSRFLWITLLTTGIEASAALQIQGPGWNARKKSIEKKPIESTACRRYWICSKPAGDAAFCAAPQHNFCA